MENQIKYGWTNIPIFRICLRQGPLIKNLKGIYSTKNDGKSALLNNLSELSKNYKYTSSIFKMI